MRIANLLYRGFFTGIGIGVGREFSSAIIKVMINTTQENRELKGEEYTNIQKENMCP